MQLRNHLLLKLSTSLMMMSLMLMATFFMSGAARAADCTPNCTLTSTGSISIVGGNLTATVNSPVINNGNPINLTGVDQQIPLSFLVNLDDNRGTGAGWRVSASSAGAVVPLVGGGTAAEPLVLTGAGVVAVCHPASSCSTTGLVLTPSGTIPSSPATLQLAQAPVGTGRGNFDITTNAQFLLPAAAGVGTVNVSITVVVSGAP